MTYPLVHELANDGIPVRLTCGVLGFSTQGFYKWRAKPICDRDLSDAYLVNAIVDIHNDDPEFGYRFITDELSASVASRHDVNGGRGGPEVRPQTRRPLGCHLEGEVEPEATRHHQGQLDAGTTLAEAVQDRPRRRGDAGEEAAVLLS